MNTEENALWEETLAHKEGGLHVKEIRFYDDWSFARGTAIEPFAKDGSQYQYAGIAVFEEWMKETSDGEVLTHEVPFAVQLCLNDVGEYQSFSCVRRDDDTFGLDAVSQKLRQSEHHHIGGVNVALYELIGDAEQHYQAMYRKADTDLERAKVTHVEIGSTPTVEKTGWAVNGDAVFYPVTVTLEAPLDYPRLEKPIQTLTGRLAVLADRTGSLTPTWDTDMGIEHSFLNLLEPEVNAAIIKGLANRPIEEVQAEAQRVYQGKEIKKEPTMTDYEFDNQGKLELWNRDHTESVKIAPSEEQDYSLAEDAGQLGLQIHVQQPEVASMLGADSENFGAIIDAEEAAKERGDVVLYVQYGDHSSRFAKLLTSKPKRNWDDYCVGIVVWPKEEYQKQFSDDFTPENALAKVDWYNKWMTPTLNGELYEAYYQSDDDAYSFGTFYDREEAVTSALEEVPHCCYPGQSFNEEIRYTVAEDADRTIEAVLTKRLGAEKAAQILANAREEEARPDQSQSAQVVKGRGM